MLALFFFTVSFALLAFAHKGLPYLQNKHRHCRFLVDKAFWIKELCAMGAAVSAFLFVAVAATSW